MSPASPGWSGSFRPGGGILAPLGILCLFLLGVGGCIPDGSSSGTAATASDLAALQVSAGSLAPGFSPQVTDYDVVVPTGSAETTITATATAADARLSINNQPATSGQPFGPIPLEVGPNTISIVVEPPGNQPPKSYTIVVTRSGVADLRALVVSVGALSPAFAPQTTSYTVSVATGVAATTVTATVADPTSVVRINNQAVTSGQPFGPIALALGANAVAVTVTAQDGTTKTYTVDINRAGPGNANLGGLVVSAGALAPAFAPDTTAYTVAVPNATLTTTVLAVVQVPTSTLSINGVSVASGTVFGPIALAVGPNVVNIQVRANDGVTVKSYSVNVVRAAPPLSNNANLAALVLSAGSFTPTFNSNTVSYQLSVSNATATTTVRPTVQGPGATVTVNGIPVASGATSGAIALNVGANDIRIVVRAQDGVTTKTYTVTVTRAAPAPSNNANLSGIVLSVGGTLRPSFDPNTTTYAVNPPGTPVSTFVTATVQGPGATLTINGAAAISGVPFGPIALSTRGDTRITIVVRAQNVVTTKTYRVDVER